MGIGHQIGQGLHYTVYDLRDKVSKVPNSEEEVERIFEEWNPKWYAGKIKFEAQKAIIERDESTKGVRERKIDLHLLGNPVFNSDDSYLQDKAVPIQDIFKDGKVDDSYRYRLIDQYILFIKRCWSQGFAERTYNFTHNNAVLDNNFILIDFSEVAFSKTYVAGKIRDTRWLKSWTYTRFLGQKDFSELREYYIGEMEDNITIESLNACWKDALPIEKV